jgi:hypothetical protein
VSRKYDVEEVLEEFLLKGKEPLINGLISGRKLAIFQSLIIAHPCSRTPAHPSRLRLRTQLQNRRD